MASGVSSALKRNLKPFNGENYFMWKFRLQEIIEQEGASSVLREDPPAPLTDEWIKWERFARGTLIEYLDDTIIAQIPPGPATARQILEKFDTLYACKKVSTQLCLQDRLFNCKLKPGMSVKKHMIELDEMLRELAACGGEINEITKVWYTLNSLPPSYAQIKAAIKTMTDERITLAFVKGMLLEHEEYLLRENADTSMKALHFRATSTTEKFRGKNKFTPRNKFVYNNKNKQGQKCFHCGRQNHLKRDCYFYKQSLKQGKNNRKGDTHASASTAVTEAFAFMMCNENKEHESCRFVLDSGATEHIVNDLKFFSECEQLKEPIRVTVAKKGSAIEATHIGKIK